MRAAASAYDVKGGLGPGQNQGAAVSSVDWNTFRGNLIDPDPLLVYWLDVDGSGSYTFADFNTFSAHMFHYCSFPNNP